MLIYPAVSSYNAHSECIPNERQPFFNGMGQTEVARTIHCVSIGCELKYDRARISTEPKLIGSLGLLKWRRATPQ